LFSASRADHASGERLVMKIFFITWQFPNFANTFILNEIVELLIQGHDVVIGSIFRPSSDIVHEDVFRFGLLDRTHYFEDYRSDRSPGDDALRLLAPSLTEIALSFPAMAEFISDNGVEFIHGDFANLGATAAMVLSDMTGIPFSFEAHSFDLFVTFTFAQEKLSKAAFITTVSEHNRNYLCSSLNASPNKIHVNRICPNVRLIERVANRPKQASMVCSVCRLTPIKGIEYAIRAVARVLRELDLKYRIVGSGNQGAELRKLVEYLGISESVEFCGPLSNGQALGIVQESSLFLLPCVIHPSGDRDGIPTAIVEAMYLRTPVITSAVSGIPEIIKHLKTGLLTEPGDVDAIADGLLMLLRDNNQRERLANAGREFVKVAFDPARSAGALYKLFADHKND
jgi:colanic acid/amylovoran biosynthesis glycosyltransferase